MVVGAVLMLTKRVVALATLLAMTFGVAEAQGLNGFYIGGGAGGSQQSRKTEQPISPTSDSGLSTPRHLMSREWGTGFVGVLSLGYGFGNGLRLELEDSFRTYQSDSAKVFNRNTDGGGTFNAYSAMFNVLYDIDLTRLGLNTRAVVPYIGVGLGYTLWQWQDVRGSAPLPAGGMATQLIDDQQGTVTYQAIAGLAFPIEAVPGLSFTAEYRFMDDFENPKMTVQVTNTRTGATRPQTAEVGDQNQSVLLGLRYAFGATPVVVPAAAPVASAKTYLVFFDWNKADLTDRARQIIGEAATSRGAGVTRIEVNGYTDRSGSDQYNQGLSVRRANAVAAELLRRGVPRNEIATRGFGESNPLVPTADGVREPQNRRVEIILK
jgi:outer membrane protein OmpA-like peptidoglycan-associated protein